MSRRRGRVGTLAGALVAAAWLGCSSSDSQPYRDTCFVGRTRIRTPKGTRALEELSPGDEIIACDPATGALAVRKVLARIAHAEAATLTLDAGDAHVAGMTAEHPIWVVSRDAWVVAGELRDGDVVCVLDRDGARAGTRIVESIRATGRSEIVFDLSVEGPEHTFFADDVLAHNKSIACPSPSPACSGPDAADGSDGNATADAADAATDAADAADAADDAPDAD